jgi:hypothetical protein
MNRDHARSGFASIRGLDLDGQAIFVAGPVDPDLIADLERRQQRNRPQPFEIHLILAEAPDPWPAPLGTAETPASNRRAVRRLIPGEFSPKTGAEYSAGRNQRDRSG